MHDKSSTNTDDIIPSLEDVWEPVSNHPLFFPEPPHIGELELYGATERDLIDDMPVLRGMNCNEGRIGYNAYELR